MQTHLSWKDIEDQVTELADAIKASGFVPDILIGIAVGGLIPLALLAKHFPDAEVASITAKSYDGERQGEITVGGLPDLDLSGKKVLLIDEITDRGTTLRRVTELVANSQPASLKSAVLMINTSRSEFRPDFVARETKDWVVFPWENEHRP